MHTFSVALLRPLEPSMPVHTELTRKPKAVSSSNADLQACATEKEKEKSTADSKWIAACQVHCHLQHSRVLKDVPREVPDVARPCRSQ
jgi:hypothetical protein